MTISELRLALDLSFDDKAKVLRQHAKWMSNSNYLFVDSSNGECYLFDGDGNEDDITKLDCIEKYLFYRDENLNLVRIPESVASIEFWAFSNCSNLTSIMIPNSVKNIEDYAFFYCSGLTSVTIPDSVTSIEDRAFFYCSELTSVAIGKGITNIGYMAFYDCTSLKKLIFKGKTLDEVKSMDSYPWGIKDESVIKCES